MSGNSPATSSDQETLRQRFDRELKKTTRLTLFTQMASALLIPGRECRTCGQTQQLLEELIALSPKLKLEVRDIYAEADAAQEQGVDRIPAILMGGDGQQNMRYFGIPSGHEFVTMLEDVIALSQGSSPLEPPIRRRVARIKEDVHIQVFVTPT